MDQFQQDVDHEVKAMVKQVVAMEAKAVDMAVVAMLARLDRLGHGQQTT